MGGTTNRIPMLWFDGECRDNPGPAVGSYRLLVNEKEYQGTEVLHCASLLEAQYWGLIKGLQKATEIGCQSISIRSNREQVLNQVSGVWAVGNSPRIRELLSITSMLLSQLEPWESTWIHPGRNQVATMLCQAALKKDRGTAKAKPEEGDKKKHSKIARMVLSPKDYKFQDFASLRVPNGRDKFSGLRLAELKEKASDFPGEALAERWPDATPPEMAQCYRWYLRASLQAPAATPDQLAEFAIHKCRVNMEITQNAQKPRGSRRRAR